MPIENELLVSRVFDAPPALIWRAWTEPRRLARWWPPIGARMTNRTAAGERGRLCRYQLEARDGRRLWGRLRYLETKPPERLVFAAGYVDSMQQLRPHPLQPGWPRELLHSVRFVGDTQTTLLLSCFPLDADTAQLAAYKRGMQALRADFASRLDLLADHLKRSQAARAGARRDGRP